MMHRAVASLIALLVVVAACGSDPASDEADTTETEEVAEEADGATAESEEQPVKSADSESEELFPDVVGVEAEADDDGSWTFAVTVSSPYDSPERYADAWRVVGPDGTVYGERILAHDHAGEQPFTRSQSGIEIPDDVDTVTVEGRDQESGWGGATMDVTLER